ncbi:MAG: diguanylate cyclase [Pseudomonadota bacterium]
MTTKNRLLLLLLFGIFLATGLSLSILFERQTETYAVHEAEKQVRDLLLNHRAIHAYINKVLRPEMYRLKDEGLLYKDYFAPQTMSFTFIARGIKDYLNLERQKSGMPALYFKLASANPRNPVNQANERELALLDRMNADEIDEYREVQEDAAGKHLYVAIPVQPSNRECMACHGEPRDAPRELVARYGDQAGFFEKMGQTRALISIRIPLQQHIDDARRIYTTLSIATVGSLAAIFLLIAYFFRRIDGQQQLILAHNQALEKIATSDYLTGIHNRLGLQKLLTQQIHESLRYGQPLSLLLIDLDHFKHINDRHGHQAGDRVLQEFVRLIGASIRSADIFGRWGGEEFIVALPQQDIREAATLAEKLRQRVEQAILADGVRITASVGIAMLAAGDSDDQLIDRADRALYLSKQAGRNRVTFLAADGSSRTAQELLS